MPLDASVIYNAAKGFNTPFENLKAMREGQEAQARTDYNRARAEEEQRKGRTAAQLQEVWTQFGTDVPEALKRSYAIDPDAAAKIEQQYSAARSNWAMEHQRQIENEVAETDRSASLLAAAKGDPELFAVIVPYLSKRDPDFATIAGTLQGPDDPAIDKLLESRDTVKNIMDRRAAANKLFLDGDLYRGAAGQLATATTPEERAEMLQGFAPHLGKAQAAALAAMTPAQLERAALKADEAADNANVVRGQDLSAATQRRGQDLSAETQRRGQNMTDARARAGGEGSGNQAELIDAVMANPAIYKDLTPSVKTAIAGKLAARGFKFGDGAAAAKLSLSAGQQQDLEAMLTIADTAKEVRELGDRTGWAGTGAFGAGTIGNIRARLGRDSAENMSLRNKVNNMRAAIAKMRGGTAFTPNEQALLDSYTPHINDGDAALKQKLVDLESFIDTKRKNMLKIASGDLSPNTTTTTTTRGANPFRK